MADAYDSLEASLLDAMSAWDPLDGPRAWPDDRFDDFARRIFEFQYDHCDPLRSLADSRGVTPADVGSYRDVPAVATDVFKNTTVATGPAERVFRTSGTTGGSRGEHHVRRLDLYRGSLHPPFVRYVLPDHRPVRFLVVAPSPHQRPDSSLSFMLGELVDRWGDEASGFATRRDESERDQGEVVFDFDWLADRLDGAQREGEPTLLFGTALGLAAFLDATTGTWELPAGSRVVETGGFKGREDELSRDQLYGDLASRLGVSTERIASEYGMTELASQAYTANLRRTSVGASDEDGETDVSDTTTVAPPGERPFYSPPWARIEVVDPASLEPLDEPGAEGLIRWYDLANAGSAVAVQTSDLGRLAEDGGVVHLGRAPDADLRGCSLTAEEIAR